MIKTVIFDLGGVYFSDGTKRAIRIISEQYKLSEQKVKDVLKGKLGTKYRIGELSDNEFWNEAKKYWRLEVPSEDLANIWLEGYKPIEGTSAIIDRLNSAGYEVLFLSDNVQERVNYLEKRYPFLDKFKDGIFSHLVHTRKPDLAIYKMVLEKSANLAEECIYIDDKTELLEPAEVLGIKGIVFENASQLELALKNAGLKF
jgi:putative hydrolase of the HAD superfamily